jgi:hypothetical protein
MASRNGHGRKKPGKKAGELVPQPHGGAIRRGAQPGTNAGGTGRPPSAIRATARQAFDEALPIVAKIVRGKTTKDSDRIRGADVLGKYGMGHPVSIDDVRECWRQQIDEIREFLPPEQSEPLLARLRPIWTKF